MCRCECGGFIEVAAGRLKKGHVQNCGCKPRDPSKMEKRIRRQPTRDDLFEIVTLIFANVRPDAVYVRERGEAMVPLTDFYEFLCKCYHLAMALQEGHSMDVDGIKYELSEGRFPMPGIHHTRH